MAITQSCETISSKLSAIPITAGQVIYVRDVQELYFDSYNGSRVQITDYIVLATENDRTSILSPLQKLYFVKSSGTLYAYSGAWVPLNGAVPRWSNSFAATVWQGGAAPYSYLITASTHGKGVNPIIETFNGSLETVQFGVKKDVFGNITLYTNEKIAFGITII